MSRTAIQTIRCLDLGSYRAVVKDGGLRIWGPLPMADKLQASVKENRAEIVELLEEYCGGAWPPLEGSAIHGRDEVDLGLIEMHWTAA